MLTLPLSSTADDIKAELQKLINRLSNNQCTAAASFSLLELLTQQDDRIVALSAQARSGQVCAGERTHCRAATVGRVE
ncbi:hypothetical protein M5J15_03860 [Serratia symbiotica]|uniref:hypothetical protein n=1 Tax=Serratia symbiotica TaxID=138074 RepID=UPI001DAE8FC9|nr:hypothetical protein [Serratia symbiotica]NIG88537.1 hypothetical protein [Serratia symbiotica]USS96214.1 hypothetical protein M5J15_03860 [Serratia symbiotica]